MGAQEIIERLRLIQPGLENSNSAAENATVEILPTVIATLQKLARHERKPLGGEITGFWEAATPCGDCVDGWCQMNCGPET